MPMFTRKEHVIAVNDKLKEAILSLDKNAKKRLWKAMTTSMATMMVRNNVPPQGVDEAPTSEGVPQGRRVGPAPPVTMTTSPTAPTIVQTVQRTHQRTTRHNTLGITSAIKRPATKARKLPRHNPAVVHNIQRHTDAPNSSRIPSLSPQHDIPGGIEPSQVDGVEYARR